MKVTGRTLSLAAPLTSNHAFGLKSPTNQLQKKLSLRPAPQLFGQCVCTGGRETAMANVDVQRLAAHLRSLHIGEQRASQYATTLFEVTVHSLKTLAVQSTQRCSAIATIMSISQQHGHECGA